jgi:uncharacterized membrane protein YidH (DUF202 family)
MLQRIQTVFLLLSAACFFLLFVMPFAVSDTANERMLDDRVYEAQDHILLIVLVILGGAIALYNIFKYKNRNVQMRLNYLAIVFAILTLIVAIVLFLQEGEAWLAEAQIEDQFGAYLPILAIFFALAANYFIRKDEKKVRSAYDRLR